VKALHGFCRGSAAGLPRARQLLFALEATLRQSRSGEKLLQSPKVWTQRLLCSARAFFLMALDRVQAPHLEDSGVEEDHDEAGYVEGPQAGPDDEVGVVEGANDVLVLLFVFSFLGRRSVADFGLRDVIGAQHDGTSCETKKNGEGNESRPLFFPLQKAFSS